VTDNQKGGAEDLTLLRFVNVVLQRRYAIARGALLVAVAALAFAVLWPRSFESTGAFIPQSQGLPSGLGGIAADFGVALPSANPTESSDFYADLLRSRRIALGVVRHTYSVCDSTPCDLAHALEIDEDSEVLTEERAIRELRDRTSVDVAFKSQLVRLTVRMRDPVLAKEVASRYLELVAEFNVDVRQTQASEESRFTAERVDVLREELGVSVKRLRDFLESNHNYKASPRLVFEHDALERDVTVRQTLLTQMLQSLEQARIAEVRNTPVLTVVDEPQIPGEPADRRFVLIAIAAMLLGAILGIMWSLWRDLRRDPGSPEMREFTELVDETLGDVRNPVRAGSRIVGRAPTARR